MEFAGLLNNSTFVQLFIENQFEALAQHLETKYLLNLSNESLSKISPFLNPKILIQIGKPELPNSIWSIEERKISYFYITHNYSSLFELIENINCTFHFEDWSIVPCTLR